MKPPYKIPSMAEVSAVPKTAGTVVSTFSGCGGSCLGFETAGFRVAWASEFVPAAREVYRLNHPGVPVDERDVREVSAEDVLRTAGLRAGEVDVLEGSPPCASFSTAGKRSAGWGQVKKYSDVKQRTDDLFFEFARLLRGLQPRAFVAENVSGLVKGVAKGYFKIILRELKSCGYRVAARVLDAQWLGVPQSRKRLIFVGARDDLGREPTHPRPLGYNYTVADACPWIVRQGDNGGFGGGAMRDAKDHPSPTIGATPQTGNGRFPPSLVESDSDMSSYAVGREARTLLPGQQSQRYHSLVRAHPDKPCPTVTQRGGDASAASVMHPTEMRKFTIAELKRICGFPDDFRLTGTYAQQWERLGRAVPPPMMRAVAEVVRDKILR